MQIRDELQQAVDSAMTRVRGILERQGLSRSSLEQVKAVLCELSARRDLLSLEDFELPPGRISVLYKLAEDADGGFALYVNRCGGGLKSPPHDHKTWAVIAAVHGAELNTVYRRVTTPDGQDTVHAESEIALRDGAGLALMPLDVHSIRVDADAQLLNLHLYGTGIDRQSGRRRFGEDGRDSGHYAPQPLIVS